MTLADINLSCYKPTQRTRLSGTITEIILWRLKEKGSRPWPYGVTWRHRSRDHSTPGVDFLRVVHSDHASI